MRVMIHQYEYWDRCSREKPSSQVTNVEEVYFTTSVPRKDECLQMEYVIYYVESVLYSFDTGEIVIAVRPIKKPKPIE